jgi:hypothetical protein
MTQKKSAKSFPLHNKKFNLEHLRYLYDTADNHRKMRKQWLEMGQYATAGEYHKKLEAVIEIMENITVFSIGDGIKGFKYPRGTYGGLDRRLDSFKEILE